jgi:hypothetical protein
MITALKTLARTGFHIGGNANADFQPVRAGLFGASHEK